MKSAVVFLVVASASIFAVHAQSQADRTIPTPIYQVTVTQSTIKAVNYEHRGGPTKIDFRGTVLMPLAKGEAKVESKRGATSIDMKLDGLEPPTRFGPEYLTYVLWAITPEGRPVNVGELVADASNKARVKVTTRLQAFGLLVSAEPYYAVTEPSNLVVAENVVRPDTAGKAEQIDVKYELLPRREIARVSLGPPAMIPAGEKVPLDEYAAILELYQARNAVQIARSAGADRYAADTLSRAEQLLQQAESYRSSRAGSKKTVAAAKEAAQAAEDARTIAMKRAADGERAARR